MNQGSKGVVFMYILGGIIFLTAFGFAFKLGMGEMNEKITFMLVGILVLIVLLLANHLYF